MSMIDFYCESVSDGKQDRTLDHHRDTLERIFKQMAQFGVHLEEESIPGLSGAAVQRWFNAMKKNWKPNTINNYVVTLNPFLRWAHTIYPEIPDVSNVLKCVRLPDYDKLPEDERPKEKYISDAEIAKLLAIPKRDSDMKKRNRAIIAMFVGTGLRAFELCQLTIGSIKDYKHGFVHVRRKGGAYKDVNVAEYVYQYVDAYLKTRPDRNDHSAPLFMTSHGVPCNPHQLYQCMVTCQKKVGVGDDRQHGNHVFRHRFVSDVEKAGGAAVARDLANHKSLVVTNKYDHSTAEQRSEAINSTSIARMLGTM